MTITTQEETGPDWNLFKKILFRFLFGYFVLYIFPFPAYSIPGLNFIAPYYNDFLEWITMGMGTKVFGITETLDSSSNGSGDRLYSYVSMFTNLILAAGAALIWSVIDFRRKNYDTLMRYLSVYVRFYVATTLMSYGFSKVFTLQFSELSLFDLVKPYGESSPMALMWNFMEYSDSFTIFSGIAEVVGGLLLLFRKTRMIGGLVAFGVMLNVFMMNMSYDIPVKLFSGHLMLMGLAIASQDSKRLLDFLILNKSVSARVFKPYFKSSALNLTGSILKYCFIVYTLIMYISNSYSRMSQYGKKAPKPALYGIYEVNTFVKNGDTLAPVKTDTLRWDRFIVDKYSSQIHYMDGVKQYMKTEADTAALTVRIGKWRDSTSAYEMKYIEKDSSFVMDGFYKGDTIYIDFKKKLPKDYLLINRGFNWVNDYPMNR